MSICCHCRKVTTATSSPGALEFLLGDPKAFLGQTRYIIPPVSSGSNMGAPTNVTYQKHLQQEMPRRHSNQTEATKPPQLTPFDLKEQRLFSELPLDILPPGRSSPASRRRKLIFSIAISFFWSVPKAWDHRWGLEDESPPSSKHIMRKYLWRLVELALRAR